MINLLTPFFGMDTELPAFKNMMAEHFPAFQKFDPGGYFNDKKGSKTELRCDRVNMFRAEAGLPAVAKKDNHWVFIAFWFAKNDPEIPFGITFDDDETAILKKAARTPDWHNKVVGGGIFGNLNDLHFHFGTYKVVFTLAVDGKKIESILVTMLEKNPAINS